MRADVVVVGAGPSGLAAAVALAEAGRGVHVVARGNGFTHWGAGAVDVLASVDGKRVTDPRAEVESLPADHPYRLTGVEALERGIEDFRRFAASISLPHEGHLGANRSQVTALGTLRTTCLLPQPAARQLSGRVAAVGIDGYRDFSAALCARGLRRLGFDAGAATVPLPAWDHARYFLGPELARAFDDAGFRRRIAPSIAEAGAGADATVLPAVVGLDHAHEAWEDLEQLTGLALVEAATPPPSVPGLRMFHGTRMRMKRLGIGWQFGFPVVGVERHDGRVTAVVCQGAARDTVIHCNEVVLATGGVAGRGIEARRDGSLVEVVAGLPVGGFASRLDYFSEQFHGRHPVAEAGVRVDDQLRPLDEHGEVVVEGLRCVGSLIAGFDPTADGSREGVALATAVRVRDVLAPAGAMASPNSDQRR